MDKSEVYFIMNISTYIEKINGYIIVNNYRIYKVFFCIYRYVVASQQACCAKKGYANLEVLSTQKESWLD